MAMLSVKINRFEKKESFCGEKGKKFEGLITKGLLLPMVLDKDLERRRFSNQLLYINVRVMESLCHAIWGICSGGRKKGGKTVYRFLKQWEERRKMVCSSIWDVAGAEDNAFFAWTGEGRWMVTSKSAVALDKEKEKGRKRMIEYLEKFSVFVKAVGMHAVPPPITGTFMPPSNNPDLDDTQVTYGSKSNNYFETNSVSNDFVSCVSSVKSSSSKTNEPLASAPSSVAFQTMSETADQQPSFTNVL
ncbi:hypothetical protein Tco_0926121 [Tanacetum coccineum]|uniref:Uncharacterized protein n=1 Tax=Tanacetum coccineum TaxID=301880 RepID=A0ABQ5DBE4_9ASTR